VWLPQQARSTINYFRKDKSEAKLLMPASAKKMSNLILENSDMCCNIPVKLLPNQ
jgi:hypothetical protein